MQKKLIAAAIAAVASTGAFAQVTMYGILDAGVAMYSGDAGATANSSKQVKMDTGFINGNRIGFKGEEDLGDGMKGYAQAEFGFGQDTSTGLNSNRQTFVGLSGGFGAVSLGRQYTPMFGVIAAVDPYGTSGLGSAVAVDADPTTAAADAWFDLRADNAVLYSKAFGPVSVQGMVGLGETDGNVDNNQIKALSVTYAQGPVVAAGVYQSKLNAAGNAKTWLTVGGTYALPVAKLGLAYVQIGDDQTPASDDASVLHLGATIPVGKGNVLLAMNKYDNDANVDFTHFGAAYHHNFGKRTIGYVQYGKADSDNMTTRLNGAGHGQGFAVGLRHAF